MTDHTNAIRDIFEKNQMADLLDKNAAEKLSRLIDRMLETNEKMNVTAIKDPDEVIFKHIADSATVIKHIPPKAKLLDVGTGGGFPALPIAILRPDVSVYALDSTAKKLKAIDETAEALELGNVKTVTGRAEELGKSVNYRERFDVVTARAVAALNVLTELCVPFVKVGGSFVAMKGSSAKEEVDLAKSCVVQLGGSRFEDVSVDLTNGETVLSRHIIISKKLKHTPDSFPRSYSRISKKPL